MRHFLIIVSALFALSSCAVVNSAWDLQRLALDGSTRKITIKKDIDLNGASVALPDGCSLVFKDGSISNGKLIFNSNSLKGKIKFENCSYEGTIKAKKIDDSCFSSSDDAGTLRFLLNNAILNGAKCDFNRDYRIDMLAVQGSSFLSFKNLNSGADISFHGHTIYNTTVFPSPQKKILLSLLDVKNLTIRDCRFHDNDKHNARNFKTSSGCVFIHCFGDCESINLLDCSQENGDCILRSGVYTHDKKNPQLTPRRGLTNSTLRVKAVNAGYGLALYCGENLNIDIDVTSPHRGFYCTGVSRSKIQYKGFDPQETKCHILIKDAVYRKTDSRGNEVLDMKGCSDLVIKAKIDELQKAETVITFQSYGSGKNEGADFTFRSGKCHHHDIDFSAEIKRYPDNGYFLICNCAADSGSLGKDDIYGCKLSGITIHDVDFTGSAKKYMCLVATGTEADITVKDCEVKADSKGKVSGYTVQVNGNATGRVRVVNGVLDNVLVNEKDSGDFDVELVRTKILHGVNYQNVKTAKKSLIRIKQ